MGQHRFGQHRACAGLSLLLIATGAYTVARKQIFPQHGKTALWDTAETTLMLHHCAVSYIGLCSLAAILYTLRISSIVLNEIYF